MKPFVVDEHEVEIEGGEGDGVTWRTLTSADRTPTSALTSGVCEILPGGALQIHRHPTLELYHFLEGAGVVTLGSEQCAVRPGTTILIPADTVHGMQRRRDGAEAVLRVPGRFVRRGRLYDALVFGVG